MTKFIFCLLSFISNFSLAAIGLNLVTPSVNQMKIAQPVETQVDLNGQFLKVSFKVATEQINAKPVLLANEYPFQFDVVELFLSIGEKLYPYYEFEVSPYNQSFVVRVDTAKKFVNNVKVDWTHSAQIIGQAWTAEMIIDLSKLNWDGNVTKIKGNIYAITGKYPNRHFWSLSLPKMKKANFHSPQFFKPLVNH